MNIKKTKYLFFHHRNIPKLDINIVFNQDDVKLNFEKQILAISILYGEEVIVSDIEFNFINNLSEHNWSEYDESINIENLLKYGILLTDSNERVEFSLFRERDKTLENNQWHIYSALFHFLTKWKGIDVKLKEENHDVISENRLDQLEQFYGLPPNHFYEVEGYEDKDKKKITVQHHKNDFFQTLLNRKTTRVFDRNEVLSLEDFSTMLFYTFGVQGVNKSYKKIPVLKKTSPSGGSLHPTEAFIFVLKVENIETGFYHYNTKTNELVLLKKYSIEEAKKKAYQFTAGQEYTANASFLAFLTTRYYRKFWKYMKHSKAYSVVIRDAAHLCQTFYLVGSNLNIGTFTCAINEGDVEDELGLNPYKHGVTMMVGCGIELKGEYESSLRPIFEKYDFK